MIQLALRPIGLEDYAVIDGGDPVGRIRRAAERAGEVWMWNVTVNLPGAGNGTAAGLDAAKAAFRAGWLALKSATAPDRLATALAQSRARDKPRT